MNQEVKPTSIIEAEGKTFILRPNGRTALGPEWHVSYLKALDEPHVELGILVRLESHNTWFSPDNVSSKPSRKACLLAMLKAHEEMFTDPDAKLDERHAWEHSPTGGRAYMKESK